MMFSEEVKFRFNERFIDNKYFSLYKRIISKFLLNPTPRRKGHVHHIIPKSIVPEMIADKDNLVCLGYREHFICHRLLPKFCKNKSDRIKMDMACKRLLASKNYSGIHITGRTFAAIIEMDRSAKRELAKDPEFKKRMMLSQSEAQKRESVKSKRSLAMRRFFEKETPEEKETRAARVRGKKQSDDARRKISISIKKMWERHREIGHSRPPISDVTRQKMSISSKAAYKTSPKRQKWVRQMSNQPGRSAIPVIGYDEAGWEMHFSSFADGAKFSDCCRHSIRKVIDGIMETAGKNPITKRKLKWRIK